MKKEDTAVDNKKRMEDYASREKKALDAPYHVDEQLTAAARPATGQRPVDIEKT